MKNFAIVSVLCLSATASAAQVWGPMAMFIKQWDGNGDGQVTLDEGRMRRAAVFDLFDQSKDGVLDDAEWVLIAAHVQMEYGPGPGAGMGGNGPGLAIHQSMTPAFNDGDANGSVTKDEFVAATDVLFPLIDRDADGVITKDDFGR